MAENMDENEIKAVADAMEELRRTGNLSAESLSKLSGSSEASKKALEGFSKQILGVGKAVGGMASSIAKGEGSFASLGSTIEATTKIIGNLLSVIPLIGGAAKALAEGVGEASKFILDQLDTMAKNYQTLGDASAGAADGVDGLLRQFNQLGNYSLPAFTKAVKANMSGLMAFKGTAAEGAEELSKVAGSLTTGQAAQKFLKLGMSLDGVGDAAAQYAADFGRMGLTQGNTTDELTKKTQNYIYEVDQIARITGQSREAQQKAQQQTLADARARATLGELSRSGQEEAAKELSVLMSSFDAATNSAIRATATGIPLTEQAQKANIYTNDQLRQTVLAVKSGEISAVEGTARIRQALAAGAEKFGKQISYVGSAFGGVEIAGEDASATLRSVAELRKKKEYAGLTDAELVKKAQELQVEAAGETTEEFTSAQLAVAGTSKNIQRLGFDLATVALPAVNAFATGLNKVTDFIHDKFGGQSNKGAVVPNSDNRNWRDGGGPNPSSGANVNGVNTQLATAVEKAIAEYKAVTGKTATITSGVREHAEQQRLYNEWIARGKTGMPVAKPGTSLHETGNAVDINKTAANEMDRLGILKKYGLDRPVAGDPVHVQLAGPTSRLKNNMAGIGPSGKDFNQQQNTKATNSNFDDNRQAIDLLASMNAKLDTLNQSSRKTADAAHKTAKNTS